MGDLDVKTVMDQARSAYADVAGLAEELNGVLDEMYSHIHDRQAPPGLERRIAAPTAGHPLRRRGDLPL